MITTPLAGWEQENAGPYPAFVRSMQVNKSGNVLLSVSEQGLMSPVAKIEMTRDEAARFFHAAWAALIYPED